MSLYKKQALHLLEMEHLLGEIFDFLAQSDEIRLGSLGLVSKRDGFLRRIGDSLDFEHDYIEKAVNGELTEDDFDLDNQIFR